MQHFRTNKPLFFNGASVYGITDGQQIGNWGSEFPVFARIENGQMYGVGIEKNASKADKDTVYKLSRAWLKNVFPSDSDLFMDVPHQQIDSKYAASEYNWGNKDQNFRASFNRSAGPSVTPTPGGSTPSTSTSKKTLKTVGIVAGVLVIIGLIVAAIYFSKKR